MFTHAYIGDLWCTTTAERRAKLLNRYDFVCMCTRCVKPDVACAVQCPKMCESFALSFDSEARPGAGSNERSWRCENCGPLDSSDLEPALQLEGRVTRTLRVLEVKAQLSGLSGIPPSHINSISDEAEKALSPAHRLVARAYEAAATFCVSHAMEAQQSRAFGMKSASFRSEQSLRKEAAEAERKSVKVIECIAAGCNGGVHCPETHPTVHDCVEACSFSPRTCARYPKSIAARRFSR